MAYRSFQEMLAKVQSRGEKKRLAVAAAADGATLEAVIQAKEKGIIIPLLVGDQDKIEAYLEEIGERGRDIEIIGARDNKDAARKAVDLINTGAADFLMKGLLGTGELMRAVVSPEGNLQTGRFMSHLAFMEIPTYHKLLGLTDCGMIPYPGLVQKVQIVENAVEAMRKMGMEMPKIAVMACVEKVDPKMPETLDADELQTMNREGELANCIIEGPLSYDIAISKKAAQIKGFESQVAGDVDLMVMPNIHAGNLTAKALLYSGQAKMAGFIVGAKVPIVLTSRSASAQEKYMSIILATSAV